MTRRTKKKLSKIALLSIVPVVGFILIFAFLGGSKKVGTGHAANPPGILFLGDFETPVADKQLAQPWATAYGANGFQCQNWGAPTNTTHYPGDFYFDNGTTSSINAPSTGISFMMSGLGLTAPYTVPPGAGNYSGRIVIPATPASTNGVTHNRTYCTLHGYKTLNTVDPTTHLVGDLGQDRYYGLMIYVPPGEQLPSGQFGGAGIWEFHFGYGYSAAVSLGLHTNGPSDVKGTGSSVVIAINSGDCHGHSSTVQGCTYKSNGSTSNCSPIVDPTLGQTYCKPPYFAIPYQKLQYGVWNEVIMKIHWAADNTGSFQSWYKTKNSSTWLAGSSDSGFPTVAWNDASEGGAGCNPTIAGSNGNCGFPNAEALEQYDGNLSAPFSVNFDNQTIGTSLAAVQAEMPGPSAPSSIIGDLNNDGHVNIFDLSILLNEWQQSGTGLAADLNKDGTVNIFDLSTLLSHYGT